MRVEFQEFCLKPGLSKDLFEFVATVKDYENIHKIWFLVISIIIKERAAGEARSL